MKKEEYSKARVLRKEKGLSVNSIADQLNVSKGTVSRWVRDIELTDKQKEKFKKNKAVFYGDDSPIRNKHKKIRKDYQKQGAEIAKSDNFDFLSLCMLYWGEGSKSRNSLKFSNTDRDLLIFYWKCLNNIFDIDKTKVGIYVSCHLDCGIGIDEVKQYWLDTFNLPDVCWKKPTIDYARDYYKRGGSSSKKLKYGCCTISISSTEIIQKVYGGIKEYANIGDGDKWIY